MEERNGRGDCCYRMQQHVGTIYVSHMESEVQVNHTQSESEVSHEKAKNLTIHERDKHNVRRVIAHGKSG